MAFTGNIPNVSVERKTTVYGEFRGVDFSVDPSLVSKNRSPYAINLISDTGGMPEKRLGWRKLFVVEEPVNGIFRAEFDDKEYYIVHGGTKLYKMTPPTYNNDLGQDEGGSIEVIKEGIANSKSTSFYMQQSDTASYDEDNKEEKRLKSGLYIMTGKEYLVFDGTSVKDAAADPYVPHVLANNTPKGKDGFVIEPPNLLTGKKMESFVGTDEDKTYKLSFENIENVYKVEVTDKDTGKRKTLSSSEYTVNTTKGEVTFTSAHPYVVLGQANVFIYYTKTTSDYKDRVLKCTSSIVYGANGGNQVFISGNPEFKNYVWYCYYNKPNYFPDTWYITAGTEESAVMGFLRVGKYLEILKEDNSQDSTIYQTYQVGAGEDGNPSYTIEQGATGIGAISKSSFATLLDEPLFLSRRGIFTIYSTNILAERTVKNRSYFLDAYLTKEENMENACAVEWNGYYLLALNNRCYVLDSKNKSYRHNRSDSADDFVYESYYWDNFPAICFLERGGELFFGTADGRICKMNTDITKMTKYNDDGKAIYAVWSTKNDDDSASYLYKSMQKKGCTVTIKPFTRSSATIYYSKDGNPDVFIRKHLMDIFTFEDIDFERFSFNTNESPQDIYLKKKVKKYKRLQLIIVNDGLNEGFGILQIAKTYKVGNYARK